MPNLEPQRYRLTEMFRTLLQGHKLTVRQFAERCGLTEQAITNALYNSDRGRGVTRDKAQRIAQSIALLEGILDEEGFVLVLEPIPRVDRKTSPPPSPDGPDNLQPLTTFEPGQIVDATRYYTPHATAQALGISHRSILKYLKDTQRDTHIRGVFYAGRWFVQGSELQRQFELRQALKKQKGT